MAAYLHSATTCLGAATPCCLGSHAVAVHHIPCIPCTLAHAHSLHVISVHVGLLHSLHLALQFPVLHRTHLDIFQGHLFPPEFKNQHGDAFLWEVYRRWGTAQFAELPAELRNCVGGADVARYTKSDFVWRDRILTDAIGTLALWLSVQAPAAQPIPCLDVVVPTFRCDLQALAALAALPCPKRFPVALHTLIVVDNPDAPNLPDILRLVSYEPNRTVRVYAMDHDAGASTARNTGLSQSFGDHAVLLDDDVKPLPSLIPAYLSAIARYPTAAGYVGLTTLLPARTLLQHAMQACGICHFYGIAARVKLPPWGVTANVCVRARTNNTVWCAAAMWIPRPSSMQTVIISCLCGSWR